MKKRIAIILIPSILFVGVLVALTVSQFSSRLPGGAQDVLDSFLETIPGEVTLTNISYARDREAFTAEMGRPLLHAPIEEYQTSPVLYDGDIIRAPEARSQFPFPAQELWCVALARQNKPTEYYFLARHDNLYGETWVLYQAQDGIQAAKTAGCYTS
jgi:hypothetical protein